MAKKGQKFKKYDLELIKEIIKYKENHSYTDTAKYFNIPRGTIITWIHKHKNQANIIINQRGRKSEDEMTYKEKFEILKKLHDFYKSQINKK